MACDNHPIKFLNYVYVWFIILSFGKVIYIFFLKKRFLSQFTRQSKLNKHLYELRIYVVYQFNILNQINLLKCWS
jgi:hypothetical protein